MSSVCIFGYEMYVTFHGLDLCLIYSCVYTPVYRMKISYKYENTKKAFLKQKAPLPTSIKRDI